MTTRLLSTTRADFLTVLRHVTPRDRYIIDLLGRLSVMTCTHITRLCFASEQTARTRLNHLVGLGVLERFRGCIRPGSQAWRYTLGEHGAFLYAVENGHATPHRSATTRRIAEIAASSHLEHRLGVNDFYTRLHHGYRTSDNEPPQWLSETEAAAYCGGLVRPDGGATITTPDAGEVTIWFEHDTGTETLQRLIGKVRRYANLPTTDERTICFQFLSAARENHFHDRLNAHDFDRPGIATTHRGIADDPTGSVWQVPGYLDRIALSDLRLLPA